MKLLLTSILISSQLSHATPNPTISPTLSIDGYPTDIEVQAYASSMHYWYYGEEYNGKRRWIGDEWSATDTRHILWNSARNRWYTWKPSNGLSFAFCYKENIFECNEYIPYSSYSIGIVVKYCINGNQSEDEYVVNGTYNGRWIFQARNMDRYVYYYVEDASWKITDKYRNNIYATCDNQNIFQCKAGIEFSSCKTKAPTQEPTISPTLPTSNPSGIMSPLLSKHHHTCNT